MPGLSARPAQAGSLVASWRSTACPEWHEVRIEGPVLSSPEGPYRRGENARMARHDSPLLLACVYAQAGRMDRFPAVKKSRPLILPLDRFEHGCDSLAAADAHRGESVFGAVLFKERCRFARDPCAGSAEGVAQRQGAPFEV